MTRYIQSLQHLLNQLARTTPSLPRLVETGVFDEPTLEAVMIFQRDNALPVTGVVDQTTWYAITDAYYQNLFQHDTPPLLHVFSDPSIMFQQNDWAAEILMTQAIMSELSKHISNFETIQFDGVNSGATNQNLKEIQLLAGLPGSGDLDRATWAILSALYRALVTRKAHITLSL